jgi:hypothetical protein
MKIHKVIQGKAGTSDEVKQESCGHYLMSKKISQELQFFIVILQDGKKIIPVFS